MLRQYKIKEFLAENRFAILIVNFGALSKLILFFLVDWSVVALEPDSHKYLYVADNYSKYLSVNSDSGNWDFFLIAPGYPLFLRLFEAFDIKLIILFQIITLMITQFGIYIFSKQTLGKGVSLITLILFVLETSTYLNSLSLLSETLFSAIFTYVVFKCISAKPDCNSTLKFVNLGLLLGISILVRPIGQVLLIGFLTLLLDKKYRKRGLIVFLSASCLISAWSIHNKFKYDSFQITGIQSFNLLYFEGVGAKSVAKDIELSAVQSEEITREETQYPDLKPVSEVVNYRIDRAKFLIFENKLGFILMHLQNVPKMMLAPGNASISRITSEIGLPLGVTTFMKIFGTLIAFSLLLFAFLGTCSVFFSRKHIYRTEVIFLVALVIITVAASTGANSYSRFRVPIVPFEVFLSGLGINLLLRIKSQRQSSQL